MVLSGQKCFAGRNPIAHFHNSQNPSGACRSDARNGAPNAARARRLTCPTGWWPAIQEEASHYLEQMKVRSTLEGIAVETHLLTSDNAAVALHQLAEQEHIDMVALSAHGIRGTSNGHMAAWSTISSCMARFHF